MEKLQYPIGRFEVDPDVSKDKRRDWIRELTEFPNQLASRVSGLLAEKDLQKPTVPAVGPVGKSYTTWLIVT